MSKKPINWTVIGNVFMASFFHVWLIVGFAVCWLGDVDGSSPVVVIGRFGLAIIAVFIYVTTILAFWIQYDKCRSSKRSNNLLADFVMFKLHLVNLMGKVKDPELSRQLSSLLLEADRVLVTLKAFDRWLDAALANKDFVHKELKWLRNEADGFAESCQRAGVELYNNLSEVVDIINDSPDLLLSLKSDLETVSTATDKALSQFYAILKAKGMDLNKKLKDEVKDEQ